MPLPPERISIKRRRHDDPVETLFLEESRTHEKKRRFTDFLFRRVRADQDVSHPLIHSAQLSLKVDEKQRAISQQAPIPGIPLIRATLPGEEIKDMLEMKAALKAHSRDFEQLLDKENHLKKSTSKPGEKQNCFTSNITTPKVLENARRFHLSREQAVSGPSKVYAGIRKPPSKVKGQLATFVENQRGLLKPNSHIRGVSDPIDRIVEVRNSSGLGGPATLESLQTLSTKQTFTQPFVKMMRNTAKTGQTIYSHPDTWDLESDQLARELAALAFEIDPTGNNEPDEIALVSENLASEPSDVEMEDDYIYETYIRLPHSASSQSHIEEKDLVSNIGVLVISEEDEQQWEDFAVSDNDADWDEEDADSNVEDNPANDYPEDEVSSGDEVGYGAYDHRNNASDEEEYDFERDD